MHQSPQVIGLVNTVSLDLLGTSRIRFGEKQLEPSSPQMFAGALYLCVESGREVAREELQQILFSSNTLRSARSHNLRQLLYRLTSAGFVMESRANFIRVPAERVRSSLDAIRCLAMNERVQLPSSAFVVLPGYT